MGNPMEDNRKACFALNKQPIFNQKPSKYKLNKNKNSSKDDDEDDTFYDSDHNLSLHPSLKKEDKDLKLTQNDTVAVFKKNPLDRELASLNISEAGDQESELNVIDTFKSGVCTILFAGLQVAVWILDFIVNLIFNECIHDVIIVSSTVIMEVFVTLVCGLSMVFATIIIDVDDTYRKSYDTEFKAYLEDRTQSMKSSVKKSRPGSLRKNLDHLTRSETQIIDVTEDQNLQKDQNFNENEDKLDSFEDLSISDGQLADLPDDEDSQQNDKQQKLIASENESKINKNKISDDDYPIDLEPKRLKIDDNRGEAKKNNVLALESKIKKNKFDGSCSSDSFASADSSKRFKTSIANVNKRDISKNDLITSHLENKMSTVDKKISENSDDIIGTLANLSASDYSEMELSKTDLSITSESVDSEIKNSTDEAPNAFALNKRKFELKNSYFLNLP